MTATTSDATSRTRAAGKWQATLLLAGSCMPVLGSVLITPVLPQISARFAQVPGADILVPLIVALPALMIAVFAPFAGQIVDRIGRKTLLIVAMFAYAVLGTAPAWLDDLNLILGSRLLVGVCEAAIMTACTTLIVDYFHEERQRNRYLGLQTVTTMIAGTVFVTLAGVFGAAGWHFPFWIYGIGAVIAVPMIYSLWEPRREDREGIESDRRALAAVPWRRVGMPLLVTMFGGFSFFVLTLELSYLVVGTGVPASSGGVIGGLAALISIVTAAGGLSFKALIRMKHRLLIPLAFALQAAGLIIVAIAPGLIGVMAGATVAGFGSGLLLPALLTWVVGAASFAERGRVTGLWTAAFFFGQFLTPIVVGIFIGATGALTSAVGVAGVAAGAVALLVFITMRGRRASAPQPDELTGPRG